ncbi:MAG: ribonuclease P protein component [bacterium]|nr:ribonuclease P protein component [bacterium]
MIARQLRVPRQDIPYILKKGLEKTSKLFIIRLRETNEQFSRYRVIVSQKIYAKAVKRNYLRRQIYEAIAQGIKEGKNSNKLDIILIPKKKIISSNYKEIISDIKQNIIK